MFSVFFCEEVLTNNKWCCTMIIDNSKNGGVEMYLSKKQVAEKFGISVSTVNNYMRQGMPFYKVGRKLVRFIFEEVENWIADKGR